MSSQLASCIIIVQPDHFGFNFETAGSNIFQKNPIFLEKSNIDIKALALKEFECVINTLRINGIEVLVLPSSLGVITPDAVFPNNWLSIHEDGELVVYPMFAANRRRERQVDALLRVMGNSGRKIKRIIDLSKDELDGEILEGTGSLVLDRVNKYAFAVESQRTTKEEFKKWCSLMGYRGIFYHAFDSKGFPIYHTNVIMSLGDDFVVFCPDSVRDERECETLIEVFEELGKEMISISLEQVHDFCENILQLKNKNGKRKIAMSESAVKGFEDDQIRVLKKYGDILPISIPIIEKVGGGSVRCMLAEVFV